MRYIDVDGREVALASIGACTHAITSGALKADTLVHDDASGQWVRANCHPELSGLFTLKSAASPNASANAARPSKAPGAGAAWWWTAAIVLPGAIAAAIISGDAAVNFGRGVGSGTGGALLALVVLAPCYLLVKAPEARLRLSRAFAVIALLLGMAGVAGYVITDRADRERASVAAEEARQALEDARKVRDEALSGAVTSRAVEPASAPRNPSPSASAAAPISSRPMSQEAVRAVFLEVLTEFMRRVTREDQQYSQRFAALPLDQALTPQTLTDERKLRVGRKTVADYDALITEYENVANRRLPEFAARVRALNLPESEERTFETSFAKSRVSSEKLQAEYFEVQHKVIQETRAVHRFMGDRMGFTELQGDQILFATSADVEEYNNAIERIQQLSEREAALMQQMQTAQNHGFKLLEQVIASR